VLYGAAGYVRNCFRDAAGTVLWKDHRFGAEACGAPDYVSQVLRVVDAVEGTEKGRLRSVDSPDKLIGVAIGDLFPLETDMRPAFFEPPGKGLFREYPELDALQFCLFDIFFRCPLVACFYPELAGLFRVFPEGLEYAVLIRQQRHA